MKVINMVQKPFTTKTNLFLIEAKEANSTKKCRKFMCLSNMVGFCPHAHHALEKEMETHSSVLAWRIPGMGEPGGLPSMGSHRARHD